jgi:nitrogen regulatory protein PII
MKLLRLLLVAAASVVLAACASSGGQSLAGNAGGAQNASVYTMPATMAGVPNPFPNFTYTHGVDTRYIYTVMLVVTDKEAESFKPTVARDFNHTTNCDRVNDPEAASSKYCAVFSLNTVSLGLAEKYGVADAVATVYTQPVTAMNPGGLIKLTLRTVAPATLQKFEDVFGKDVVTKHFILSESIQIAFTAQNLSKVNDWVKTFAQKGKLTDPQCSTTQIGTVCKGWSDVPVKDSPRDPHADHYLVSVDFVFQRTEPIHYLASFTITNPASARLKVVDQKM